MSPVVREALAAADTSLDRVERIAVTRGPGLVGALLVGLSAAKALAWAAASPSCPSTTSRGTSPPLYLQPDPLEPPFLCLLASGGHTLLLAVRELGSSERIGTTLDDAAGEAFDKGARLLGLGYPGGAEIDRLAATAIPDAFSFPGRARAGARLLVLRAEDRAPCTRSATWVTRSWSDGGPTSPPRTSARS